MRRSLLRLGPEEWQIALLKRTASPAAIGSETAALSSMGASICCSRVSRLSVPKCSRCGSGSPRWEPGITRRHPASSPQSESAKAAITTIGLMSQ